DEPSGGSSLGTNAELTDERKGGSRNRSESGVRLRHRQRTLRRTPLAARRAEAAAAARGVRHLLGGGEAHALDPLEQELRDAVTGRDPEGLVAVVHQHDLELAPVVAVDHARERVDAV